MWMVKASAQRPELVQMLQVAFSRRICCSRVESVSTQPRRPRHRRSRRRGGPASGGRTSRAWRTGRHRARRNSARCRATGPRPRRCPRPCRRATSQAQRHGLGDRDDQQRARGVGGLGERVRSCRWPKKSGFCTTTQAVSASISGDQVLGRRSGRRGTMSKPGSGHRSRMTSR